jgi:hypothetical protein
MLCLVRDVQTHRVIERVGPMPKRGVTSMFRFGYAAGTLYGLIVGFCSHPAPDCMKVPQHRT